MRWLTAQGVGVESPFMQAFAQGLAAAGLRVAMFEFPYMTELRSGRRRPPDREPVLRQTWLQVTEQLGAERLVIGGKSMGGRIASLVADDAGVAGLICLGYPFHPAGQPEKLRVEHLRSSENADAYPAGRTRCTRQPLRSRWIRTFAGHRTPLARRRGPQLYAPRGLRPDRVAELAGGDRGGRPVRQRTSGREIAKTEVKPHTSAAEFWRRDAGPGRIEPSPLGTETSQGKCR